MKTFLLNIWNKIIASVSLKTLVYILLVIILLLSIGLVIASVTDFVEYSSFPIGLTKATLGILLLKIVDDTIFGQIKTINEIQNKNIAYALIYLANAVIIAACIASA